MPDNQTPSPQPAQSGESLEQTQPPKRTVAFAPVELRQAPARFNGNSCKVTELCRLVCPNGYDSVLIQVSTGNRNYAPMIADPPTTAGWGYAWRTFGEPEGGSDHDLSWAFAHAVRDIVRERDELRQKLEAILAEANSCGFLNRGEFALTDAEAFLDLIRQAEAAPYVRPLEREECERLAAEDLKVPASVSNPTGSHSMEVRGQ